MIQNAIIIDHHKPTGKVEHIHFNPHLAGIDGSSELCASCGAYMVARQMGENSDLAGLAIAGAIGDKQPMTGSNKSILDEAIRNEVVSSKKGLRMGDDPVEEYLEYSFEPFLDITGDKEKIRSFTESAGIRGSLKGFSEVQLVRFASLLALKLAQQGNPLAINSLIGDVFFLNKEVVSNAYDLVNILNACGSVEKADLGLAVCMRDASIVEEAKSTAREHQRIIVNNIRKALGNIRSAQNFRYVHLDDSGSTGAIAGTMTRYLYPDKPFITLNEVEDRIKVSARGTRKLVMTGLDLAAVMRESAESVGGIGGGHDVASGASIPKGTEPKFLEVADSMIGRQLAGRK
ncbi:MAG TPA: DHH family phosphoesterase, partial [Candidatus Methanoperedens sp.]